MYNAIYPPSESNVWLVIHGPENCPSERVLANGVSVMCCFVRPNDWGNVTPGKTFSACSAPL